MRFPSLLFIVCVFGSPTILWGQFLNDDAGGFALFSHDSPRETETNRPIPEAPFGYYDVYNRPRVLPFMSHLALDRGYKLPLPFGAQVVYTNMNTKMDLTSVQVGFSGSPPARAVPLGSRNLMNETHNLITRLDTWVLPFVNVYGLVGQTWIDSSLDLTIDSMGSGIVTLPIRVQTNGLTYGYGTTLAGGYENWFISVDANKTFVDLDELDSKIKKTTVSIRSGFQGSFRQLKGAVWIGAMRIDRVTTLDGTLKIGNPLLDPIRFRAVTEMDEPWNFLLGFNWEAAPFMNVMLEGGIGSRTQVTTAIGLRF